MSNHARAAAIGFVVALAGIGFAAPAGHEAVADVVLAVPLLAGWG